MQVASDIVNGASGLHDTHRRAYVFAALTCTLIWIRVDFFVCPLTALPEESVILSHTRSRWYVCGKGGRLSGAWRENREWEVTRSRNGDDIQLLCCRVGLMKPHMIARKHVTRASVHA